MAFNANKVNKDFLKQDTERLKSGSLGMGAAEKRQMTDAATVQAGAGIEAMNQNLAQDSLAAGGGAGPSARYAMLQRDLGSNVANATSMASGEAERISQAKALSEKQDITARTERQQAVRTQKAQFWGQLLLGNAGSALKAGAATGTNLAK